MQEKWILPKQNTDMASIKSLAKQVKLPFDLTQLLVNRGYQNAEQIKSFLHPSLQTLINDINLPESKNIKGVGETCQLIKKAIHDGKKIQLYDDYDVDGITSASIMYLLIKNYLGYNNVNYFIPNRFKDGYGPNLDEYKRMYKSGMQLLITTDNGISGIKEIKWLKDHGVQVIITDHHNWPTDKNGKVIASQVPNADVICMANCPYHKFHFDDFCGAGIAFMIACKMLHRVPVEMLDLACLGTIADSVSLTQENRIIVAFGLRELRNDQRKGVRALAGQADIDLTQLSSTALSFTLIPRLNAIGRMDDANMAVKLLTTDSTEEALKIANTIEGYNNRRQTIMRKQSAEAIEQADLPENKKKCTLVLHNKHWFPGIVGIIASRVIEHCYKPTIVIGHLKADDKENIDRGSGRSIPEFDLFKAMEPIKDTMTSFGGHPMACGLSIKPNRIKDLADGLEKAGQRAHLDKVVPTVKPNLCLKPNSINMDTLNELKVLEPFGVDNEAPLIDLKVPHIYRVRQMGKTGSHLSFTLGQSFKSTHVVAFGMGDKATSLENNPFDIELAGVMNINHYKGHSYLQFMVQHMKRYVPKPTRDEFKIVYAYLYQRKSLQYDGYPEDNLYRPLGQYLNIRVDKIKAILKVFAELNLLTLGLDEVDMNLHPSKCKLEESVTYQNMI